MRYLSVVAIAAGSLMFAVGCGLGGGQQQRTTPSTMITKDFYGTWVSGTIESEEGPIRCELAILPSGYKLNIISLPGENGGYLVEEGKYRVEQGRLLLPTGKPGESPRTLHLESSQLIMEKPVGKPENEVYHFDRVK